jgi:hypothetical protein
MKLPRRIPLLANRCRQFHGKRTPLECNRFPVVECNAVVPLTKVGVGTTALATIVAFCYTNHKSDVTRLKPKARRFSDHPSSYISLRSWFLQRSNHTQCESSHQNEDIQIAPEDAIHVHYSELYDPDLDADSSGYTEEERFYQCVMYHRSLLHDYDRRWGNGRIYTAVSSTLDELDITYSNHHNDTKSQWPRNVPNARDATALECDLMYCQRSPEYQNSNDHSGSMACQSTKYRIATFYVSKQNNDLRSQREKGFRVVKELAEQGYPDAMCLYGTFVIS